MWYMAWIARYIGGFCLMIALANFQLTYPFNFPAIVPYTIMVLSLAWVVLGMVEFDKHIRSNQ